MSEPASGGRLRRNWLLVLLLTAGAALRIMSMIAYQPGLIYIDSYRYLDNLNALSPQALDPIGYDLLLRALLPLGGIRAVVGIQHLAGLGIAVAVYAIALRHGARRWLAAIATVPVLLDAYQVQIEQNVMSDLWFEALIVAALWLLLNRAAPRPGRAAAAGLVLGLAFLIRTIALPLAIPALGYLIVAGGAWRSREGWQRIGKRAGALLVCFGLVVFCYAGYFHRESGYWGLTGQDADVLYGRTANVANCAELDLPPLLARMCPAEPLDQRKGVDWYAHLDGDPDWPPVVPAGMTIPQLQHDFSMAVLRRQSFDVIGAILGDFAKGFGIGRDTAPGDVPVQRWQFQPFFPVWQTVDDAWAYSMQFGGSPPVFDLPVANVLRGYQLDGGYTPGPALAVFAVLGLLGGFGAFRRRSGIRAATLLTTSMGLLVLLASAAFEFSWRYQLPGLVLLPLGGVLGLTVLFGPSRRPVPARARKPGLGKFPNAVDYQAMVDFGERYGVPSFAPVVVVIAAFNEENGIGGVLERLPDEVCGLGVDVVVVADGCSDGTVEVARGAGVCVVEVGVNRGQGAALRLGYGVARWGGARFVVTTDADGQYENGELGRLVGPLVAGEADFVTGSRRLGSAPGDDRVRWVGVRVFAWLASVLVGARVSDTSFGFRAMRVEVASGVRLRQPQYQASELLLGVFASGARVCEVPMTMRVRSAGKTKKGNNLVYGLSYARVMTWTWLREFILLRLARAVRRRRANADSPTPDPAART